jgi:Family of unknown function (DUF5351)
MTKAQQYAERYVEKAHFDPGYVSGFLDGVKWQKSAALKNKKRPKKECPYCKGSGEHGPADDGSSVCHNCNGSGKI